MSLRLEMLQVARLAPKLLGDSAPFVEKFLRSQQNEDGGFQDRAGKSDLYYTVFGIEGLLALQAEINFAEMKSHLLGFGDGSDLDFVHLCCLARCWSAVSSGLNEVIPPDLTRKFLDDLKRFRTPDGGFNQMVDSKFGTAYGAFLGLGAYHDLKTDLPEPLRLFQSLQLLETEDGAWTNEVLNPKFCVASQESGEANLKTQGLRLPRFGSTNATAAVISVLRNLSTPVNSAAGDWLLTQAHPQGGFVAAPGTPIPDLLSTATSLHALAGLESDISRIKEPCLDFIDSLWTNEGGFFGHWQDDHLDCEYTYYGLLALGHLSF